MVARDVYGRHPDELEGVPFACYMLADFIALALVETQERAKK